MNNSVFQNLDNGNYVKIEFFNDGVEIRTFDRENREVLDIYIAENEGKQLKHIFNKKDGGYQLLRTGK